MSTRSALTGHLIQSATIVLGVLVALVLGSMWEYLGDRLREGEYEAGLLQEFNNAHLELAADQAARDTILERTERLLDPTFSGTLHPDSLPPYLATIVDFRFFTPSHPVLEDLIAGGKLDLLQSDALRSAILRYVQERDRLEVVEERERRFVSEQVEPYLVRTLMVSLRPEDELYFSTGTEEFEAMLRGREFRTLMALRWDRTDLARRFATGLGFRIADVIEALGG
ncbi:MAG: hypothetical protein P8170_19810 [Gemmatimonadota bacterium]